MEQGVVVYLHVVGYDGTESISLPDSLALYLHLLHKVPEHKVLG